MYAAGRNENIQKLISVSHSLTFVLKAPSGSCPAAGSL